uniref:Uncharacterized protein n=1 Tax=Physcomitrium patens TaxID=3218 RepID=A0A2K1K210_PHYPA|nr:hypothetical protein PHYPA_012287 [Physcomitrium patens]
MANIHFTLFIYLSRIGCCGTGTFETAILCNEALLGTCTGPFPYVWWASFHPTDHVYSLIAVDLFNQAEPVFDGSPPPPPSPKHCDS